MSATKQTKAAELAAIKPKGKVADKAQPVCKCGCGEHTRAGNSALATNEYHGGKERTEYHDVVTWVWNATYMCWPLRPARTLRVSHR
jgi:hypothetical protein